MVKSIKEIRSLVKKKVKERTLKALTERLNKEKLSLWGIKKGCRFIQHSVLVALYKDLDAVGYCELKKQVGSWSKITEKSLSNNQKRLKEILATWGMEQVEPENYSDWERAKRRVTYRKPVKNCNFLWIQVILQLQGRRKYLTNIPLEAIKKILLLKALCSLLMPQLV
jgi:hypothetical protein